MSHGHTGSSSVLPYLRWLCIPFNSPGSEREFCWNFNFNLTSHWIQFQITLYFIFHSNLHVFPFNTSVDFMLWSVKWKQYCKFATTLLQFTMDSILHSIPFSIYEHPQSQRREKNSVFMRQRWASHPPFYPSFTLNVIPVGRVHYEKQENRQETFMNSFNGFLP